MTVWLWTVPSHVRRLDRNLDDDDDEIGLPGHPHEGTGGKVGLPAVLGQKIGEKGGYWRRGRCEVDWVAAYCR